MSDPTGTAALRRSFLAEGNRRLARVRSLTHMMLVEHDLMQTRTEPVAQLLPHPGHRLPVFADWFARTVIAQLLGGLPPWWERYLARAYDSGLVAGNELVKSGHLPPSRSSLPAVYRELSSRELAGIAAALVQQVSRQAGGAAIGKQKPQLLYRQVLGAIRKVGEARLKAFVNMLVVKLHNAARLEHFRASGITQVGIIPELRELARPSRFLKHDHALHDRAPEGAAVEAARRRQQREEALQQNLEQARTAAVKAEAAAVKAEAKIAQRLLAIGAEYVNVLTAGDDLVCQICEDISEEGPYSLDEAQGLIPAHPNCRCAFVPALTRAQAAEAA